MCTILSAVPSVSHKRPTHSSPPPPPSPQTKQTKQREASSMFLLTQCWNSEGWPPQNPWQWEQGVREVEQYCLEWALPGQTWRHLGQLTVGQLTAQEPSLLTEKQRKQRTVTGHPHSIMIIIIDHIWCPISQEPVGSYKGSTAACIHHIHIHTHGHTHTHTQRSTMHVCMHHTDLQTQVCTYIIHSLTASAC